MSILEAHHGLAELPPPALFLGRRREGTIARACDQLHLTQPSISKQLRQLEHSVGEKLFKRVGRNLVLTETGQLVFRYADEIFSLGRELSEASKGSRRESGCDCW